MEKSMRHYGIAQECIPCILKQCLSTARFAQLEEGQTARILAVARQAIEDSKVKPLLVQHVVRQVADAVIQERGESPDFDIYAEVKQRSNALSLACVPMFQNRLACSPEPIEMGLHLAAAGNIIDFGAKLHDDIDLEHEIRNLDQTSFARYDIQPFRQALHKASNLLYICDNSGEIVFDRLFLEELMRQFPRLRITAALRARPIINDATLEDARAVGLDRLVRTISSGSVYPGTILDETTAEFQTLFAAADVILSKGQGNFETLHPLADERLFFLLRIKCDYMANLASVVKGGLVLIQGSHLPSGRCPDSSRTLAPPQQPPTG